MPIIVMHQQAQPMLQGAANAGSFQAQLQANQDDRANLALQEQMDRNDEAARLAEERIAQDAALREAALVERQRAAMESNATKLDVADGRNKTALELQDRRGAQQDKNIANTSQNRADLADRIAKHRSAEQQAVAQGRYDQAHQLQQERLQAEDAWKKADQDFKARMQEQQQAHQRAMQTERVQAARSRAADKAAFDRQVKAHAARARDIHDSITRLQKQLAATPNILPANEDGSPSTLPTKKNLEARIEAKMNEYQAAAAKYDAFLGGGSVTPSTQPVNTPAASTAAPATTTSSPIIVNRQTGERMQLDPASGQWVPIQ